MAVRLLALALIGAGAVGCTSDCDDALGKLEFCELPAPAALAGDCDDETPLACQARCVRDTSCERLTASILRQSTAFSECTASCGASDLLDELAPADESSEGAGGNAEQ